MANSIFEKSFPAISRWINEQGWIEIGTDENSDSLIRVINEGGLVWESTENHQSINEALHSL